MLDGKCGYMDVTGKMKVIQPQYAAAHDFSEGLAAVSNDERNYGFIDKTNRMVISASFQRPDFFRRPRKFLLAGQGIRIYRSHRQGDVRTAVCSDFSLSKWNGRGQRWRFVGRRGFDWQGSRSAHMGKDALLVLRDWDE